MYHHATPRARAKAKDSPLSPAARLPSQTNEPNKRKPPESASRSPHKRSSVKLSQGALSSCLKPPLSSISYCSCAPLPPLPPQSHEARQPEPVPSRRRSPPRPTRQRSAAAPHTGKLLVSLSSRAVALPRPAFATPRCSELPRGHIARVSSERRPSASRLVPRDGSFSARAAARRCARGRRRRCGRQGHMRGIGRRAW